MSNKIEAGGLIVGTSMATAPATVPMIEPFDETQTWMAVVAVTGLVVLVMTGLKVALSIRRELKWDGEDRRGES